MAGACWSAPGACRVVSPAVGSSVFTTRGFLNQWSNRTKLTQWSIFFPVLWEGFEAAGRYNLLNGGPDLFTLLASVGWKSQKWSIPLKSRKGPHPRRRAVAWPHPASMPSMSSGWSRRGSGWPRSPQSPHGFSWASGLVVSPMVNNYLFSY